MNARRSLMRPACHLLLQILGLLLPRRERIEWLAEWKGELHHAFDCQFGNRECLNFCLGAIPAAFWLRRSLPRPRPGMESPRRCLALLAALATVSVTLTLLLPATRRQILPPAYHPTQNLAVVSPIPVVTGSEGEVTASQYLAWRAHPRPGLLQTAFYLPTTDDIQRDHRSEAWSIGRATSSFALLLQIPVSPSLLNSCRHSGIVPLVLSHHTWVHEFAASPTVVGRTLHFRTWKARIVAIAPPVASYLPMQMNAWTIETKSLIQHLSFRRYNYGFMLARLAHSAAASSRVILTGHFGQRLDMYLVPAPAYAAFYRHQLIVGFAFGLLICCLMIPAILYLCPETGLTTEQLPIRKRLHVWLFFLAKLLLLLPTLLCAPLLVAHGLAWSAASAQGLQALLTLGGTPLAAFWAISDQRQRCPHCLRKLSSPARVGDRSHTFLSFSGTELFCTEGHGLLHVPDYPTSWFRTQRWLPLDASWHGLFETRA
jgi:hypothetical protein